MAVLSRVRNASLSGPKRGERLGVGYRDFDLSQFVLRVQYFSGQLAVENQSHRIRAVLASVCFFVLDRL